MHADAVIKPHAVMVHQHHAPTTFTAVVHKVHSINIANLAYPVSIYLVCWSLSFFIEIAWILPNDFEPEAVLTH